MTGPTFGASAPALRPAEPGDRPGAWRRARWGVALGLVAGILAAAAAYVPAIDTWERRALDVRVRAFARPEHADRGIVAVVVDQKSLDAIAAKREHGGFDQGWPWPRNYHATVLRYLLDSGARAVGFDLVFSEPSAYTKLEVADDDMELGKAGLGHPVVHAAVFTREAVGRPGEAAGRQPDQGWPTGILQQPFTRAVNTVMVDTLNKAALPVKPILESARGLGWIGFDPDPDGIFRSIRPAAVYAPAGSPEALEVWSLPLALAAVLERRIDVLPGRPAAAWLAVDGRRLPLDEDGRLLVRFHGDEDVYRRFSYVDVLDSATRASRGPTPAAARPAAFRDKVVLIGASAAGLLDLHATSVSGALPGWALHAAALDNVLHGDAIRRPRASTRVGVLLGIGMLCGGLVALARSLRASVLAALALAALYAGAALWAFDARGWWLDVVSPALALGLACAGASGYVYLTAGRERRFLRAAFSRHLAAQIVEELVERPSASRAAPGPAPPPRGGSSGPPIR